MTLQEELTKSAAEVSEEDIVERLIGEWDILSEQSRKEAFLNLDRANGSELFLRLPAGDQAEVLSFIPPSERRSWIRLLAPDDAADLVQTLDEDDKKTALFLLDPQTRTEVTALLAYREDQAGGLMNSRFARLRPDMTVEEAIRYLRQQTSAQVETIYYAYVLDNHQTLLGAVSLRQLFTASPNKRVDEIMSKDEDLITIGENVDQEVIAKMFSKSEFLALPVVDDEHHMKGIVTVDDVVQVVQEEATEDIQKFGGVEALNAPYFKIGFSEMVKKRAGWLLALFIGEMFTATAMGYYQNEISKAVVLALFIPLVISAGGNSGSQASTLVIRAMALGEIRIKDLWRVFLRELASGVALGVILGCVGLMRIMFWPARLSMYGPHYAMIAMAVGFSLIGIVTWGTLTGSMLPFAFRFFNLDPATASAPFVATLVDVTGLIIYFTVASVILGGTLL